MNLKDIFLVSLVAITWGFNFVIIKWGLEDVDPYIMTAFRFLFTSIPIIFFIKKPNIKLSILAMYGLSLGVGVWAIVYYAMSLSTPAGLSSLVLQGTSVFLSIIAGVILFKEKMLKNNIVGMILASFAFSLILYSNFILEENIIFYGLLLVLLAGAFFAVSNVIIKKYKPKEVISFIVYASLFVPFPMFALSYLLHPDNFFLSLSNIGFKGYASILFQAYIVTLLGYSIWTHYINKYGLVLIAPYSLLVPLAGVFFSWLIYDEQLNSMEIVGSILVMIALMLSSGILKIFKN